MFESMCILSMLTVISAGLWCHVIPNGPAPTSTWLPKGDFSCTERDVATLSLTRETLGFKHVVM